MATLEVGGDPFLQSGPGPDVFGTACADLSGQTILEAQITAQILPSQKATSIHTRVEAYKRMVGFCGCHSTLASCAVNIQGACGATQCVRELLLRVQGISLKDCFFWALLLDGGTFAFFCTSSMCHLMYPTRPSRTKTEVTGSLIPTEASPLGPMVRLFRSGAIRVFQDG